MNGKKKRMILAALTVMTGLVLTLTGCGQSAASPAGETGIEDSTQAQMVSTTENRVMATGTALSGGSGEAETEKEEDFMRITVGDRVLTAVLADNSSAEALKEILMAGPLTIDMSDHGNMEKVGPIGQSLPTNDEQITTGPGDIILYMGDSLVIYYDTNSWNFTRLGKIQDVTQAELKEILGGGNVTVTLSLGEERTSGEQTGTVQAADQTEGQAQGAEPGQGEKPVVYMTDPITPEGLMAVYDAAGRDMKGKVAVKLSMGEPGGHNYLSPDLIKDLVARVDGTIVDSNTAYGGQRASTALHLQVAEDHGFAAIAPIDILDSEGTMDLPVAEGEHLTKDIVGAGLADYDSMLVLSHFKGHAMGGFGGALKNISIGVASQNGKLLIHSGGASDSSWSGGTQDDFLESMAEAAKAVSDHMEGNMVYISVMNNLSVDCDCDSDPAQPDMHDIGILASTDPVALDQACVDLVYAAEDGASLIQRIESRNGILTVVHAQEIGLGSREYTLVSLDE